MPISNQPCTPSLNAVPLRSVATAHGLSYQQAWVRAASGMVPAFNEANIWWVLKEDVPLFVETLRSLSRKKKADLVAA